MVLEALRNIIFKTDRQIFVKMMRRKNDEKPPTAAERLQRLSQIKVRRKKKGRKKKYVVPEHLQRVGLMDLNATFGTVITLLKVLHNAALTDCRGNNTNSFCSG